VQQLIDRATKNRAVAETQCNSRSSRSHSVFTLKISGFNSITSESYAGGWSPVVFLTDFLQSVMTAQWENQCLSLSEWPGFNSRPCQSLSKDFSLADHTSPSRPEPAWQKMTQSPFNGTTQPAGLCLRPTTDRQLWQALLCLSPYGYRSQ